ncbi:hypothetical protein CBM2637_A70046 [Cupriavidus taiwanensis]|nr:hypothetical protein CBM2637_A70046 [Cupriavidus taiwanensis]
MTNQGRCHRNDTLEETLRFSKVIGIDAPNLTLPYTGKARFEITRL